MMEKIVPDPFLKYRTSKNLWINNLRFYAICFYCMSNSRAIKLYWSWAGDHLLCCYIKAFQKKKRKKKRPSTSLPTLFCAWFLKKIVSYLHSIKWPKFIICLSFLVEILGSMCIVIICYSGCQVINFEVNLIFPVIHLFTRPKTQDKNLKILKTKRVFKMKHFWSFWKGFYWIK